jgi:hypothetical protein
MVSSPVRSCCVVIIARIENHHDGVTPTLTRSTSSSEGRLVGAVGAPGWGLASLMRPLRPLPPSCSRGSRYAEARTSTSAVNAATFVGGSMATSLLAARLRGRPGSRRAQRRSDRRTCQGDRVVTVRNNPTARLTCRSMSRARERAGELWTANVRALRNHPARCRLTFIGPVRGADLQIPCARSPATKSIQSDPASRR